MGVHGGFADITPDAKCAGFSHDNSPVLWHQLGVQQFDPISTLSRISTDLTGQEHSATSLPHLRHQLHMGCPDYPPFCLADYKFGGSHDCPPGLLICYNDS